MSEYLTSKKVGTLPRLPLEGTIDLTYRCNNDCRHCWLWLPVDAPEKKKELTFEEIRRIVDEARALGCREWSISGGEPMLREDFPEIFDYIARNSMGYTLNTNGTLITPRIARLMKRHGKEVDRPLRSDGGGPRPYHPESGLFRGVQAGRRPPEGGRSGLRRPDHPDEGQCPSVQGHGEAGPKPEPRLADGDQLAVSLGLGRSEEERRDQGPKTCPRGACRPGKARILRTRKLLSPRRRPYLFLLHRSPARFPHRSLRANVFLRQDQGPGSSLRPEEGELRARLG